jgi:hypothetical protein
VGGQREDPIGGHRQCVRDQHLLSEADGEAADPLSKAFGVEDAALDLGRDVAVAHDRPRNQLRKKRDEQRQLHGIRLRFCPAPVDVDDVGERLEGEEGDADRKVNGRDLEGARTEEAPQRTRVPGEEPGVFEPRQKAQIAGQGQQQDPAPDGGPPGSAEPQARQVVDADRREHQQDEDRLSPRVEEQAREEQGRVPKARRGEDVQEQNGGEEEEQECKRAEGHGWQCRVGRSSRRLSTPLPAFLRPGPHSSPARYCVFATFSLRPPRRTAQYAFGALRSEGRESAALSAPSLRDLVRNAAQRGALPAERGGHRRGLLSPPAFAGGQQQRSRQRLAPDSASRAFSSGSGRMPKRRRETRACEFPAVDATPPKGTE